MSLTDIMSGAGLSLLPQAALLLFVAAFATVVVQACVRGRDEIDRAARLPLSDGPAAEPQRAERTGP
jgi:hypothetical protein